MICVFEMSPNLGCIFIHWSRQSSDPNDERAEIFHSQHQFGRRNINNYPYLPTYAMVQIPSWEANWLEASQEIPRILRNPKFHYRTHKRPPPIFILGQPNPVHKPTSYLVEIHSNFIQPSAPRPSQWSLSLRPPHQDPIHPPPLGNH